MLVNAKAMLEDAKKGRYALPAPDYIDLDSARVFVKVAEKLKKPLLLSYPQVLDNSLPLDEAAAIGKIVSEKASVPVALHLDHGLDIDFIARAIDLGFTSVMIDASAAPFEENVRITKEVTAMAHSRGVSVEAEIGHVGQGENYIHLEASETVYTTTEEAASFVNLTGVDSLAVSIGTVHGVYKNLQKPVLNFQRLQELARNVPVPLVLHGGSGTGDENLRRCATEGIAKINIFTDFLRAASAAITSQQPGDYMAMKQTADEAMAQVLQHYYELFSRK